MESIVSSFRLVVEQPGTRIIRYSMGRTYEGVDRSLTIMVSLYIGPVFMVNSVSAETMSITGTSRYYFTDEVFSFVR